MLTALNLRLSQSRQQGNFRELKLIENLIDFSSNDYLGLARSPHLAQAVFEKLQNEGFSLLGSTGSRLLTGNSAYAQDLEDSLAKFHGFETGLLFNCGYMANLGLLSTVAGADDVIFYDLQVHASAHDGVRLSRARAIPFRHNDLNHLEQRLQKCKSPGRRLICVESIYSTDGSKAPLMELCSLAKLYDAHLIVDEAHAVGVWGPNGRGCLAENSLQPQVLAQVTTFGKALGIHGAIVFCSNTLKKALINFARPYIYTTALPFLALAAIKSSYEFFPLLENQRQHVRKLIQYYRNRMQNTSDTQIQAIKISGNSTVKRLSLGLASNGFDIRPLLSPTVRKGEEMLRICLHAFNTEEQIDQLISKINQHKEQKN